eukprot:TRINITY_DN3427_c0_g1_i1.p1 TRINITY_DN3427_c0_g1~~TRINITY_DN3427_c0_g1_i1.p1  ORF type:complete len:514 (-),score=155.67 TRINITY_DN3427_c0_g1_i1:31-1572(-)
MEETKKYILILDVGSTSVRSTIFNEKLVNIGYDQQSLQSTYEYPQSGWVEQDPEKLWEITLDTMKKSIENSKVEVSEIKAIGIACQRASVLTWTDEGKPLHNIIPWQDIRSQEICEQWNKSMSLKGINTISNILHFASRSDQFKAGSMFKFSTWMSCSKVSWVLKNIPEAEKLAKEDKLRFGGNECWLLWKLTGGKVWATDVSHFSTTGFWDPFTNNFNEISIKLLGVPKNIFPPIKDTCGDFGLTNASLFGVEIPIRCIIADQSSALFGECCFDIGDSKITMGSGSFMSIITGKKACSFSRNIFPVACWRMNGEIVYTTEGGAATCGTTIEWTKNNTGFFGDISELSETALSVENTGGVFFVPSLAGLRAPHNSESAKGAILGITTGTKKEHIVRALLEGLAFRLKDLFVTINKGPNIIKSPIKIDGGVSKNDFLVQFLSDLLNVEIQRPENVEMTTQGTAFMVALQLGWYAKEELKELWKPGKIFKPGKFINAEQAEKLYEEWLSYCARVI